MGGREAPPHFVDQAVFAYFCSGLFWVVFGIILMKYFRKLPKIGYKNTHQKRPAKMAREARHFVDEAVLVRISSSTLDKRTTGKASQVATWQS